MVKVGFRTQKSRRLKGRDLNAMEYLESHGNTPITVKI